MEDKRSSSSEDRKLEAGTAHTPEPPSSPGGGLHPAFYIGLWIFLSSSIILFNKWILTTAKFGARGPLSPSPLLAGAAEPVLMCSFG